MNDIERDPTSHSVDRVFGINVKLGRNPFSKHPNLRFVCIDHEIEIQR